VLRRRERRHERQRGGRRDSIEEQLHRCGPSLSGYAVEQRTVLLPVELRSTGFGSDGRENSTSPGR